MALNTPTGQPGPMQPGEFEPAVMPTLVRFGFNNVTPPSPIYVKTDDVLNIVWSSSLAGETVTVSARLLQPNLSPGNTQPDGQTVAVPAGGGVLTVIQQSQTSSFALGSNILKIPLAEGFLLAVGVSSSNAVTRGVTFAKVFINRAAPLGSGVLTAQMMIFADYVTVNNGSGWPLGRVVSPIEGPGFITNKQVINPGAGADWSFQPPTGVRIRVQSWQATLTTSAVAANRIVQGQYKAQGVSSGLYAPSQLIPASTTAVVVAAPGMTTATPLTQLVNIALPSSLIVAAAESDSIGVLTNGIQAADQWSNISVAYEQWLEF